MPLDLLDPGNDDVFKHLLADSPVLLSALINAVGHDRPPVQVVQVLNRAILPAARPPQPSAACADDRGDHRHGTQAR